MASRGKKERGLKQLKVGVFNMGNRLGNDGLGRPPPTIFKIRWAMVVCGRKDGDHHPQSCYLPVMGGRPSTWSIAVLCHIPHKGVTPAMDMLVTYLDICSVPLLLLPRLTLMSKPRWIWDALDASVREGGLAVN